MTEEPELRDTLRAFINSEYPEALQVEWVVAVSGGVDSMVLLNVVKQVADEVQIPCRAVHVHHGLRAAAEYDSEFVQIACERLGVSLDLQRVQLDSLPLYARKGTEADARSLRYQAIAESVLPSKPGEYKAGAHPVVFLGHHADDQTETVLMRLARGTSMSGLAGMRAVREAHGLVLLRPFLQVDKVQLIRYADIHDIKYVEDETNHNPKYTRNFIRHEVVPRLSQVQPQLNQAVARLTDMLQAEDAWLTSVSQDYFEKFVRKQSNHMLTLCLDSLLAIPLPLQRRVIKIILYCLAPADWTFEHVDSILRLCEKSGPSAILNLPNQILVRKVYQQVEFSRGQDDEGDDVSSDLPKSWDLKVQAVCTVTTGKDAPLWVFRRTPWSGQEETSMRLGSKYEAVMPRNDNITLRPAGFGERMCVLGMSGSKKVQDLFVDAKIPRHLRSNWPCVYAENQMIWIPGVARANSFLLTPGEDGWHIFATPSNDLGTLEHGQVQ